MNLDALHQAIEGIIATIPAPPNVPASSPESIRRAAERDGDDLIVIESKIADHAGRFIETIQVGVNTEAGIKQLLEITAGAQSVASTADAIKIVAILQKLLSAWLRCTEPALVFISTWQEECRALGYDVSAWGSLAKSVETYRRTQARLNEQSRRYREIAKRSSNLTRR